MPLTYSLGGGREFDRIRQIVAALGPAAGPLGDDCVPIVEEGGTVVLSTDMSIEGVHFRADWLALSEIGWRVAAAALSDLAAEGAAAVGALVALGVPAQASDADVAALMGGVGAAVAAVHGVVLGGDLSASPVWTAAVTVVGRAETPVTRAGAAPGDGLWVTGALGGARAALEAWQRGDEPPPAARQAFAHPEPRLVAGQWLAGHGARAMLDLSDGLAGDAAHLAAASSVGVTLVLDRVPVAADVAAAARRRDLAPEVFAAAGGEDYELLAALPPDFGGAAAARCRRETGIPLTRVGDVVAGRGVDCTLAGRAVSVEGFGHFR